MHTEHNPINDVIPKSPHSHARLASPVLGILTFSVTSDPTGVSVISTTSIFPEYLHFPKRLLEQVHMAPPDGSVI